MVESWLWNLGDKYMYMENISMSATGRFPLFMSGKCLWGCVCVLSLRPDIKRVFFTIKEFSSAQCFLFVKIVSYYCSYLKVKENFNREIEFP